MLDRETRHSVSDRFWRDADRPMVDARLKSEACYRRTNAAHQGLSLGLIDMNLVIMTMSCHHSMTTVTVAPTVLYRTMALPLAICQWQFAMVNHVICVCFLLEMSPPHKIN